MQTYSTNCYGAEPKFEEYRPVEEDVLKGFEQYTDDDKENETEFDGEDAYQMVARFNDTSPEYDEETGDTDLYGSNGVEAFEGFLSTGIDGYHGLIVSILNKTNIINLIVKVKNNA